MIGLGMEWFQDSVATMAIWFLSSLHLSCFGCLDSYLFFWTWKCQKHTAAQQLAQQTQFNENLPSPVRQDPIKIIFILAPLLPQDCRLFQGCIFGGGSGEGGVVFNELHSTPLHSIRLNYSTLHYTSMHYTTLHTTTLHYITLHSTTLHYTTLPCIPLHYTTLHSTTLHSTTLQLHYTTFHYTTLHSTTLH